MDCISINVILGGDNLVFILGNQAGEELDVRRLLFIFRMNRSFHAK